MMSGGEGSKMRRIVPNMTAFGIHGVPKTNKRRAWWGINGRYRSTECPRHRHFQPLVHRFSNQMHEGWVGGWGWGGWHQKSPLSLNHGGIQAVFTPTHPPHLRTPNTHAPRAATSGSTHAKSNLADHLIMISTQVICHKPCHEQSGRDAVA